jgi:AcrR family transcriptional regulator
VARRGLTRERIFEAAREIVDRRGLEALTMRSLGQALGVEAMSLYRHVKGKDELLDGIHGAILSELPKVPSRGDWTTRLFATATAFRTVLRRHPRALQLFATRPAVAPSALEHLEAALEILDDAGFAPHDRLRGVHALLSYVVGSCIWQLADQSNATAPDYPGLPATVYPHLSRMGPVLEGWDYDVEFMFGLRAMIAGLEASRTRMRRPRRKKRS